MSTLWLANASVYTMIDDAGALANNYTLYFVKLILSKTREWIGKMGNACRACHVRREVV